MMSLAPVMELSHFLCPYPLSMEAVYQMFQFSGYAVPPNGLSLRDYAGHPDVRKANLLAGREFAAAKGEWTLSGSMQARRRADGALEVEVPRKSKGKLEIVVDRIGERKPIYSLIVRGRLTAGKPAIDPRLVFYDKFGNFRDSVSAGLVGKTNEPLAFTGGLATLESTEVRLELFGEVADYNSIVEITELTVLRHPVFVPVIATPQSKP
jgi:hypothetical protein